MPCTLNVALLAIATLAAAVASATRPDAHHDNNLPTVVEFHIGKSESIAEKNSTIEIKIVENELHLATKETGQHCDATTVRSSCSGGELLVPPSGATFQDYCQQMFHMVGKNILTFVEFSYKHFKFATVAVATVSMLVMLFGVTRAWSSFRNNGSTVTTLTTDAAALSEGEQDQVQHNDESRNAPELSTCGLNSQDEGEGKIQSDTSISPSASIPLESHSSEELIPDVSTPIKTTMSYLPISFNVNPSQNSDNDKEEEEDDENDGQGTPSLLTQAIDKAIDKVSEVIHKLSQSQQDRDDSDDDDQVNGNDHNNVPMSSRGSSIEEFEHRFEAVGGMKRSMTVPLRMPSSTHAPAPPRRRRREKTPIRSRNPRPSPMGESSPNSHLELSRGGSSEDPISVIDDDDDKEDEIETF